jgi:hypothetical protein
MPVERLRGDPMKYLILLLLLSSQALAAEIGTITVILSNGKTRTYTMDKYAVVKRGPRKRPAVVAKKDEAAPVKPIETVVIAPAKCETGPTPVVALRKNRVRVMGGIGPNGVEVEGGPKEYLVSSNIKALAGVGYNRLLTDRWSVDASAFTNQTFTLGVGFDF